jgi:hypothetical protein
VNIDERENHIGSARGTPGTFQPSRQIDGTGAKLLIEALSGHWSYDTDRREKRTVWYHVANSFSLFVSTIVACLRTDFIELKVSATSHEDADRTGA